MINKCNYAYANSNKKYLGVLMFLSIFILLFLVSVPESYAITSNTSANSSNYNITVLDSSLGGDVQANPEISQNIPKTNLSTQIFNMTKQGSVVLKFGNGNGPKLLISAGIHGNEPEANIAVMKYLELIKDMNFNGTIYVIPFDIPENTALNVRDYNGQDPNRIANINGTPGYNIIKFAQNNGINYLLDVHSGTGVSVNGLIYTNPSYVQSTEERNWTSYIVSQTGSSYNPDPAESPGMIRSFAHSKGMNTITLEVEKNTIPTATAAETEFHMILAAAQYLGLPSNSNSQLHVTTTDPAPNAVISLTAPVKITFSENIIAGPNYSGIYIKNLTTGNTVSISKSISGNILTIKQSLTRLNNNIYQVYIPAGGIKDTAGNTLAAVYLFQFKASSKNQTAPIVTSTDPTVNASQVPLTSPVTITFSENILAGPNFSGIYIKNIVSGALVTMTKSINGKILTIQQTTTRKNNTIYKVYIPAGAVKNAEGNNLAADYTYNFTTVGSSDLSPPTVTATDPVNNATGASLTSPVLITFSENIISGANFSQIYIKNLTTGNMVSIASETISGNTLTIKQSLNRLDNNSYQVCIPAGAVKDLSGNNLTSTYIYTFKTTGTTVDTIPPTITSTNPSSNATGFSLTSPVTINFSETVLSAANFSGIYIKNLTTGKTVSIGSKTINGSSLTIVQASSRLSKNTYQVYIPAGAVKDAAGNNLATAYTYNFQTA